MSGSGRRFGAGRGPLRGRGAPGAGAIRLVATAAATVALLAAAAAAFADDGRRERGERGNAPEVEAEATVLVDATSGAVIAAEAADQRRPIASATKLMTALLTLERTEPRETFTAAGYDPTPAESQIGLADGERMRVRDLLVALLLESANDAAVTLAEGIAGSTEAFVAEMNERADRLGLDDTSYANPIGFDERGNYSSASDLAVLAGRLMREPRFRDLVEEPRLRLRSGARPRVVENRNELLGSPPGVDGIKTGHTLAAGYVLVGSATRDDARVISVVLGAPSEAARDAATRTLLAHGLRQFRERRVVRAGEPVARAALAYRDEERVTLTPSRDVAFTVLRGQGVETRVDAPSELEGPLAAGDEVGSIEVLQAGRVVERVPLVTARAVEEAGTLTRLASTLRDRPILVIAVAIVAAGAMAIVAVRVLRTRRRDTR